MRAVITLEDDEQFISMNVVYEGTANDPGFCIASHAHQQACIMLKILDAMLVKREQIGETRIIEGEELVKEIDDAFERVAKADAQSRIDYSQIPDNSPLFQNESETKIKTPKLTVVSH